VLNENAVQILCFSSICFSDIFVERNLIMSNFINDFTIYPLSGGNIEPCLELSRTVMLCVLNIVHILP